MVSIQPFNRFTVPGGSRIRTVYRTTGAENANVTEDAAQLSRNLSFAAEDLRRMVSAALHALAEQLAAGGDANAAIPYARRWLALDRAEMGPLLKRGLLGAVVAFFSFGAIMLATRLETGSYTHLTLPTIYPV